MEWTFQSNSLAETERLGRLIASRLSPGMVVGLVGPMGSGKTHLVKAIAQGLGVSGDEVNSPTFVLIQEYAGELPLYHFDTYRLKDVDEFLELGAEELFSGPGVCLVEWADRFVEVLPPGTLWVSIRPLSPFSREWTISGNGLNAEQVIEFITQKWS